MFNLFLLLFAGIGRRFIDTLAACGRVSMFCNRTLYHCLSPPFYWSILGKQLVEIGFFSLPLVGLTAVFTGAALILQTAVGDYSSGAAYLMPGIVIMSLTRELGPVLIGLVLSGRVSASIAAEIGTMRINEQIEALVTLNTNEYKYLVTPRVLAAVISLPLLVLCADIIGAYGGYVAAVSELHYDPTAYIQNTIRFLKLSDVLMGMIKSVIFGFVIAFTGCYYGYYCRGGAKGVGLSTTLGVVFSSIFIITSNYFVTLLYIS